MQVCMYVCMYLYNTYIYYTHAHVPYEIFGETAMVALCKLLNEKPRYCKCSLVRRKRPLHGNQFAAATSSLNPKPYAHLHAELNPKPYRLYTLNTNYTVNPEPSTLNLFTSMFDSVYGAARKSTDSSRRDSVHQ